MRKAALLSRLRQAVSPAEWEALEDGGTVSTFHRETLLEMRNAPASDGEISAEQAAGLWAVLRASQPPDGKYAVLASLYLAFLAGRPLHSISQLEIRTAETGDGVVYECPRRSALKGTVCDYCVCRRMSNYEITKRQMARSFAQRDHEETIRRFHLDSDEDSLRIRFLNSFYRIHRRTGTVTREADGSEADFNEAMTLYDVLCNAKAGCAPDGEFVSLNHLVNAASKPEQSGALTERQTRLFDGREAALDQACRRLGGEKYGKGDVAYRLPLFDFLPVALQFWSSDDEFPASLQLLWDRNTLDFMHFETVWYAAGHLTRRLEQLAEEAAFSQQ